MLTQSEIDAIIAEVAAGEYDTEDALTDIAQKQKGEDVRKALYSLVYTLLQEGKAGSVDMIARNEIQNYLTTHSGQWGETVLWEGSVGIKDDTIELSESCENYDFIDIYSSLSRNVISCTGESFKYGFSFSEVSDLSASGTPSVEILSMSALGQPDPFNPDGINFVISSAKRWKGTGADVEATSEDATSESPVGFITKIVGRKLLDDAEIVDAREGYDGTVYGSVGEAVRAQISEAMQGGGGGGTGLTQDIKQSLLECFAHTAWTDDQGQEYYDDLEDALYPFDLLSSISAVYTQSGTVYDTDSLDDLKSDLVVTGNYSDGTYNQTAKYTLSGTLTAGTSTITASYGGKTTTFSVTVTGSSATLTSISAVYTQSGTVYDTDSLDSLKSDLVVTATYSDSTTATIPATDYTLSGSLTVGTSTVTVSYSGESTTFSVTVTAHSRVPSGYTEYDYLTTTTAAGDYVDTGLVASSFGYNSFAALSTHVRMKLTATPATSTNILGCRSSSSGTGHSGTYQLFNQAAGPLLSYLLGVSVTSPNNFPVGTVTDIEYVYRDGEMSTVVFGNETPDNVASIGISSIQANNKALLLYGTNRNGTKVVGSTQVDVMELGEIILKDANGVKVLEFVPVYSDADQKYGYYETVQSIFYGCNNGTLTGGNWS